MRRSADRARSSASRTSRTSLVLALGVALPTVLLALGWAAATVRERSLREEAQRVQVEAMLGSLDQAIAESLEELRAREDERPYYLWGHYYSPPDVLSLTDAVAISPLAAGPGDPRVIGHFQLGQDGRITTPYAEGPLDERAPEGLSEREASLALAMSPAVREALAARLRGEPVEEEVVPAGDTTVEPAEPGVLAWASPFAARRDQVSASASSSYEGGSARVPALELNTYGSQLAQEIEQAQAGDPGAREQLWERGRAVPQVSRRTREAPDQAAPERVAASDLGGREESSTPPIATQRADDAFAADTRNPDPSREPPIEIEYTPMRLERVGGALVLVRTVSDAGASFLQGVVLDARYLESSWLPPLVTRFVLSEPPARLVASGEPDCALLRPLSRTPIAPSLSVCVEARALGRGPTKLLTWIERGLLLGLAAIVGLALLAVHRAAAREAELSRQKSQFVSAVSHELRTPLTTIRMHAEMLEGGLVDEERRPRVHEELVSETVRLSRLVENVLEASRLEEGRRPVRPRRADLRAHVGAVVDDISRFARGKGFELLGPGEGEPIELAFDAGAIEQVVVNLIDNAIKYAADGERRIEVAVEHHPHGARILVRDHGPGIPASEQEKVFERFHRVERAEQAHQPGTGLGLSIVRELVRAHRGEVTLRDRVPRGLEVVVTLPSSADDADRDG